MEIEIVNIESNHPNEPVVDVKSEYGTFRGVWRSSLPNIGDTTHVELTIPEKLEWGKSIVVSENKNPGIVSGDQTIIDGTLEGVDNQLIYLRLGKSLLMVETVGDIPKIGSSITATVNRIEFSDSGI